MGTSIIVMGPDCIGRRGERSPDNAGVNFKTGVSQLVGINEAIEARSKYIEVPLCPALIREE